MSKMKINFHKFDLDNETYEKLKNIQVLAFDTETTGLIMPPARLCLIQLFFPEINEVHMVHFPIDKEKRINNLYNNSKNLKELLRRNTILKIAHYARFDCLVVKKYLKVKLANVVCTKILSQVCRTYSDKHGLKDLCREILDKSIDKGQQTSDWGRDVLTEAQKTYAAQDVIFLPELYEALKERCEQEERYEVAKELFKCIPCFVEAEAGGFNPDKILNPFYSSK